MAPLAPRRPAAVAAAIKPATASARQQAFNRRLPEDEGPLTLAQSINRALADELAARPELLVFGEDVARKGGVYGVTRGLLAAFGAGRVFDSLLDEQSVLGLALGAGLAGLLPVPEIQYLAYLHNAADQIRGEAATLSFFSQGGYRNPLVVRIAGLAYQQGFGGHFHNDNAVGALRDIPGLIVACPARPEDAAAMLRTCLASAREDGSVCVFLEPIALYHERDLHEPGDGGWLARYEPPVMTRIHAHDGSLMAEYARERRIFVARRLADLPIELEELAEEFEVSRERARQIEVWFGHSGAPPFGGEPRIHNHQPGSIDSGHAQERAPE